MKNEKGTRIKDGFSTDCPSVMFKEIEELKRRD